MSISGSAKPGAADRAEAEADGGDDGARLRLHTMNMRLHVHCNLLLLNSTMQSLCCLILSFDD